MKKIIRDKQFNINLNNKEDLNITNPLYYLGLLYCTNKSHGLRLIYLGLDRKIKIILKIQNNSCKIIV